MPDAPTRRARPDDDWDRELLDRYPGRLVFRLSRTQRWRLWVALLITPWLGVGAFATTATLLPAMQMTPVHVLPALAFMAIHLVVTYYGYRAGWYRAFDELVVVSDAGVERKAAKKRGRDTRSQTLPLSDARLHRRMRGATEIDMVVTIRGKAPLGGSYPLPDPRAVALAEALLGAPEPVELATRAEEAGRRRLLDPVNALVAVGAALALVAATGPLNETRLLRYGLGPLSIACAFALSLGGLARHQRLPLRVASALAFLVLLFLGYALLTGSITAD